MKLSRVQLYGADQRYHRVCIPSEISTALEISSTDVVTWEVLDDNTVIMKRLRV
jgi:bifunctional DNA-binding transcriptional regulator/antitoxin component of YhaV-PrlF toxin-antitoxin module